MASRSLREQAGILAILDRQVNPAVHTLSPDFPTIPAIVVANGLPVAALQWGLKCGVGSIDCSAMNLGAVDLAFLDSRFGSAIHRSPGFQRAS